MSGTSGALVVDFDTIIRQGPNVGEARMASELW
jgi:hypothetical protein